MKRILVIGSANVDMIMGVARLPGRGETVTDGSFMRTFGGKGANQAVAAKRAGAEVSLLTCLGEDDHGSSIIHALSADGIDLSWTVRTSDAATGAALVMYDNEGVNYLTVAPGANYSLEPERVLACVRGMTDLAMIMLQFEITEQALHASFKVADEVGVPVLFNHAPARKLSYPAPPGQNSGIVVNEIEATAITGVLVEDARTAFGAAVELRKLGFEYAIVTLGAQGACVLSETVREYVPAVPVAAVDSTAAGDSFCGAFAAARVEGRPLHEAVQFATVAASLCVQRVGAQPSIPFREEIDTALLHQKGGGLSWP